MGNFIEKYDSSLNGINDKRLTDLKSGTISDLTFIKNIKPEDPYFIRNKTLMTIDSSQITDEIKRLKAILIRAPIELRLPPNLIEISLPTFIKTFPEITPIIETVKKTISEASCKGCIKNKELAKINEAIFDLQKKDLQSNIKRDLTPIQAIVPDIFLKSWNVPLDTNIDQYIKLPRMINTPSPEEIEVMKTSAIQIPIQQIKQPSRDKTSIEEVPKPRRNSVLFV